MAETLTTLTDRLEEFLADKTNKSWPTTALSECIQLSLYEVNRAAGATYTIDDLGGAAATTLPEDCISALLFGAAAYAAKNRTVDRMEKASLGEGPETGLSDWGDWAEKQFISELQKIRKSALAKASTAPHSEMTWEEDPHKW